ncbi:MAG: hypothetical protein MK207_04505 [Saprospiraceae bacterium]|nr:hypothetical protein [Saprospiraceae bacterium]
MKDILDFDENNAYVDYFFVYQHQLDAILELLNSNQIAHRVKVPVFTQDTLIVPHTAETNLIRKDFVIQIPENQKMKVDYLMSENEDLLQDSRQIRKLFLINSLDTDGLIDILLFPQEWLKMDQELAIEILNVKGVFVPQSEYAKRRNEREEHRKTQLLNRKLKGVLQVLYMILVLFLSLFLIFTIFDLRTSN